MSNLTKVYTVGIPCAAKGLDDFFELTTRIGNTQFYWFCYKIDDQLVQAYPSIEFITGKNDYEMHSIISEKMDVFVSCSHFEGFCLPVAEAIMNLKPAITYELEEIKSTYGPRIDYVKPFDLDDFERVLRLNINNIDARRLSEAKLFIIKQFSAKSVTKRLLKSIGACDE